MSPSADGMIAWSVMTASCHWLSASYGTYSADFGTDYDCPAGHQKPNGDRAPS